MNTLPASGRTGRTPPWPISQASPAEAKAWRAAWKMPQALVWESQHLERLVARYVRVLLEAEEPNAGAALLGQVVKLEERLLLTPYHLKQACYQISTDELAEKRTTPKRLSAAERLAAVPAS